MKLCLTFLALFCAINICHGLPDGAPQSTCSSLTPVHPNIEPQTTPTSFTVSATKSGNKVRVTISSSSDEEFQGFILQARESGDRTKFVNGEFTTSELSKTIDCLGGQKNTLTHVSASPKKTVVTEWTPRGAVDSVIFRATVAKTFSAYWTEIDSLPVKFEDGVATAKPKDGQKSDGIMYDDCFVSKGCFGLPLNCAEKRDCEVLVTYGRTGNGIQFNMLGYLLPSTYMALGLSHDSKMGGDSVTECIRDGSNVIARESWNEGKSNTRTRELPKNEYSSSFSNGLSSCSWLKPHTFKSNEQDYDLSKNNYYVLLAKGEVSDGSLKYHSDKISSGAPINFTTFEAVAGAGVTTSVKIHGTFMVTAWVGFVSFAILLARHFKNTWEDSTLGGVKVWFALHRAFMISGLLFVVVAFVVIFIHKDGWNYETSNPHAILGCVATALGLLNPIMAVFRPAPDHPKRPIFNWLHWGVGNSAQIVAVITIFFAVSFKSSGLDKSFYWAMAVFVIVHLLFHLLFQVHLWTQENRKSNNIGLSAMSGARSYNFESEQPVQPKNTGNEFRLFMLVIYTMFVLAILISLYSLIGVA